MKPIRWFGFVSVVMAILMFVCVLPVEVRRTKSTQTNDYRWQHRPARFSRPGNAVGSSRNKFLVREYDSRRPERFNKKISRPPPSSDRRVEMIGDRSGYSQGGGGPPVIIFQQPNRRKLLNTLLKLLALLLLSLTALVLVSNPVIQQEEEQQQEEQQEQQQQNETQSQQQKQTSMNTDTNTNIITIVGGRRAIAQPEGLVFEIVEQVLADILHRFVKTYFTVD